MAKRIRLAALDMDALTELADLYSTKNHKLLISLAKEAARREQHY